MKKLIAKLSNAIRDRRREKQETTKIEIGESYHVRHSYKKDFFILVKTVNDTWVVGLVMDAETLTPGEEIITMRELCKFTKLEGKEE